MILTFKVSFNLETSDYTDPRGIFQVKVQISSRNLLLKTHIPRIRTLWKSDMKQPYCLVIPIILKALLQIVT